MFPIPRMLEYGNIKPIFEVERNFVQAQYTNVMVQVGTNLYGYGGNNRGQLGIGTSSATNTMQLLKSNVERYYLGTLGTIVVGTDKKIYYSGDSTCFPQAGLRYAWFDISAFLSAVGITADNLKTAEIAESTRILSTDGRMVYCGRNNYGECGVSTTPVNVLTVSTITNISSLRGTINGTHIVLRNGDALYCGMNTQGEAGVGDKVQHITPVLVTTDVYDVAPVYQSTQWIKNDGTIYYSGYGSYGQNATPGSNASTTLITLNTSIPVFDLSLYFNAITDKGNAAGVGTIINSAGTQSLQICGINTYGRIGRGDVGGTAQLALFSIPLTSMGGYENIQSQGTYNFGTFILAKDNKLYACGGGGLATAGTQLPDGTTSVSTMTLMQNMPWY